MKRRSAVHKISTLPEATPEQLQDFDDVCAICYQVCLLMVKVCVKYPPISILNRSNLGNAYCKNYKMQTLFPWCMFTEMDVRAGSLSTLP